MTPNKHHQSWLSQTALNIGYTHHKHFSDIIYWYRSSLAMPGYPLPAMLHHNRLRVHSLRSRLQSISGVFKDVHAQHLFLAPEHCHVVVAVVVGLCCAVVAVVVFLAFWISWLLFYTSDIITWTLIPPLPQSHVIKEPPSTMDQPLSRIIKHHCPLIIGTHLSFLSNR